MLVGRGGIVALAEQARVLITVKASPEPSTSYGDTVCVAGIRLDSPLHEWIRLYPVPFRYLDNEQKFKKYDVLSVNVVKATKDARRESFSPDLASIQKGAHLKVSDRANHILPLVKRSMCQVQADIGADLNGPSLAIVHGRQVKRLVVTKHPGWTQQEAARLAHWAKAPDLFGTPRARQLQAPRFKATYEWLCDSPECKGHAQRLLDWELTAFQRRFDQDDDATLANRIKEKFLDDMFSNRAPHFYVGNFASGPKRKSFSILGVFAADRATPDEPLF